MTQHYPADLDSPNWDSKTFDKMHEWRRYVDEAVIALWPTFSVAQKRALYINYQYIADQENWDW